MSIPIRLASTLAAAAFLPSFSPAQPAPLAKFEAASVRPCEAQPAGRRGGVSVTPGRLHASCITLAALASIAWGVDLRYPIEAGPPWTRSDTFNIEAEAQGNPPAGQLQGVLLQALLEERFNLKIRRETREVPIYALTETKKGFQLQPLKEGGCTLFDPLKPPDLSHGGAAAVMANMCAEANTIGLRRRPTTGMVEAGFHGITLDDFAKALSRAMDRKVVNRSQIAGRFDIQMQFSPDEAVPAFMPGGRLLGFAGPPAPPAPTEPGGGPSISPRFRNSSA